MKEEKEKRNNKTRYENENEKREQIEKKIMKEEREKERGNTWNEVEGGERTNIKGTEYNIDKPLMFKIKMLCHSLIFI